MSDVIRVLDEPPSRENRIIQAMADEAKLTPSGRRATEPSSSTTAPRGTAWECSATRTTSTSITRR